MTSGRAARIALAVAVAATAWFVWLAVGGGFDGHLLGVRIRTNNPHTPALVAAIGWLAFAYANGIGRTWQTIGRAGDSAVAVIARVDSRLAAAALALATFALCAHFRFVAVGGSDSYGYVSEADMWLSGETTVRLPWVKDVPWANALDSFTPLAWRPLVGTDAMVPICPPGLAMLLAAAKSVAGECAMFVVVPATAMLLVLATFGLGRRIESPHTGLVAAWLMATSPTLLYMATQPMSDVPAAAAWTGALYFAFGRSAVSAAAAGALVSAAILTRPNLAPLASVIALPLAIDVARGADRRTSWARAAAFAAMSAVGVIVLLVLNDLTYGSPFEASYGDQSANFAVGHAGANLKNFASWLTGTETPLWIVGVFAVTIPSRRWWRTADRARVTIIALFAAGVVAAYAFYLTFGAWWFLRFLLPAFPAIMIGLGAVSAALMRTGRSLVTLAAAVGVVALGLHGLWSARERQAFDLWREGSKYATVGHLVRTLTNDNSVVLSLQHSGSLRYYAGRVTLRYNAIEPDALDETVRWLASRGAHPYAVLEDWEAAVFRERFSAQATAVRVSETPMLRYAGAGTVLLYDLLPLAPERRALDVTAGSRATCESPAPRPALVLSPR